MPERDKPLHGKHHPAIRTMVLIPALNEADTVAAVIADVQGFGDVVVVDDGSSDATIQIARGAGAVVLPMAIRTGAWVATQVGLRYALCQGYDRVVTVDADGQHEGRYIRQLLAPILNEEADVSIGACIERGSWLRRVAWVILKGASGLALEDITSGFRAYGRAAVEVLAAPEATLLDYQDVGVLVLLQASRMRICEVQVKMPPRQAGHSRVFGSWLTVGYYMYYSLLLGGCKR